MKGLAVLSCLLGVMALVGTRGNDSRVLDDASVRSVAINYALYRNEVFRFATAHPDFTGEVPLSSLSMPSEWSPVRTWRNHMESGVCYVYGPASEAEKTAVRNLFQGSLAIGGEDAYLPPHIPESDLVSVIQVKDLPPFIGAHEFDARSEQ